MGAQAAGPLTVSVHDQNGAPLNGVRITLVGGGIWSGETDSTGAFTFRELPPGDYVVGAALTGFQPATRTVRVQPGTTRSLSLTLSVALLEQVAVTATKAGDADIQTTPMAVSAVSRDVRRWHSSICWISIASKCCADHKARCTDATLSAARST